MGDQNKHNRRTKSPPGFAMIESEILTGNAWKAEKGSAAKVCISGKHREKTNGCQTYHPQKQQ